VLYSNPDDLYDAVARIDFVSDRKWIDNQESSANVTRLANEFWLVLQLRFNVRHRG